MDNIYSTPESDVEIDQPVERELASRWARLGAAIVDGLIIGVITVPLMFFSGSFDSIKSGVEPSLGQQFVVALAGIVAFVIIHGHLLMRSGQTWGKKLLGIKIVAMDNTLPTADNYLKRYGFYFLVPYIPFIGSLISLVNILFIFSKSKRCLHDKVGNTKVVVAK